jgi:hypothetical protein
VRYDAWDASNNTASCDFMFEVILQEQPVDASASSSGSSLATVGAAAGGGGGGLLVLLLLLLIVLFIMRRNHKKKLSAAAAGYRELMSMSDDFILERARVRKCVCVCVCVCVFVCLFVFVRRFVLLECTPHYPPLTHAGDPRLAYRPAPG